MGAKKLSITDKEWREKLTPEQYHVCRQRGTEAPFSGKYNSCKENGTYRCVCCGEPLFHSNSKFDSGCGWPSFSEPSRNDYVEERSDHSHGMQRIEVLCANCDAHLGHVFNDGPAPTHLRYCINSVAIDLEKEQK